MKPSYCRHCGGELYQDIQFKYARNAQGRLVATDSVVIQHCTDAACPLWYVTATPENYIEVTEPFLKGQAHA